MRSPRRARLIWPPVRGAQEFSGQWVVEPDPAVRNGAGLPASTLRYEVSCAPVWPIPATLVSRLVRSGLPANICAVAERAEAVRAPSVQRRCGELAACHRVFVSPLTILAILACMGSVVPQRPQKFACRGVQGMVQSLHIFQVRQTCCGGGSGTHEGCARKTTACTVLLVMM